MTEMDKSTRREIIVKRIAKEFRDGYYVNLGVGMPSLVANYLPEGVNILLHGENGMLGMGEHVPVEEGEEFPEEFYEALAQLAILENLEFTEYSPV